MNQTGIGTSFGEGASLTQGAYSAHQRKTARMNQDFRKTLWATAYKLCANMDAAEYKRLVLGLKGCSSRGLSISTLCAPR